MPKDQQGIQGSHIDFLICVVAARLKFKIFTTDKDFKFYSKHLPISLLEKSQLPKQRRALACPARRAMPPLIGTLERSRFTAEGLIVLNSLISRSRECPQRGFHQSRLFHCARQAQKSDSIYNMVTLSNHFPDG